MYFASSGKFFHKYFILFIAMVNGIVSFISLCFLLLYRNARNFCVLILYPVTLLYSLVSSSNFLVVSLGFSMLRIMTCANCETFTYTFPIWTPFDSFFGFLLDSSVIAVAKTSKTRLNSSGESVHLCLVSDIKGN